MLYRRRGILSKKRGYKEKRYRIYYLLKSNRRSKDSIKLEEVDKGIGSNRELVKYLYSNNSLGLVSNSKKFKDKGTIYRGSNYIDRLRIGVIVINKIEIKGEKRSYFYYFSLDNFNFNRVSYIEHKDYKEVNYISIIISIYISISFYRVNTKLGDKGKKGIRKSFTSILLVVISFREYFRAKLNKLRKGIKDKIKNRRLR
ncbi:hypothetical protein JOL62DRAFT_560060 [Phyllosticta paracitricarpa]|uniref:Uncharacterized protein n=1 Tax=Phyllosticta paracitricarpa TaxID=2016321 RepID=A0ABR1MUJ7_9PEZI